jgi:hypothetical protein
MAPPKLVLEELSPEEMTNAELVNAHLAVASLTIAWHYLLRVSDHGIAAGRVEEALQSAIVLREQRRIK